MSDIALDVLDVALAIYKDKVHADLIEDFKKAYRDILEAEGENRRTKAQVLLQRQFQLEIQIEKIETLYSKLKAVGGPSSVIEDKINKMKRKRNAISAKREASIFTL
ncbi:MAG: hypothetical protein MR739_05775 [Spirochaetia bacterium]|nr:hypothetical protein [Spirochaetia bacterium]